MGRRAAHVYRAHLLPLWDYWVVVVPEAAGVHAPVQQRADARLVARDAIAMVLGVDAETVSVVIEPGSGPDMPDSRRA